MAIITLKRIKEGILTRHADISREMNGQERPKGRGDSKPKGPGVTCASLIPKLQQCSSSEWQRLIAKVTVQAFALSTMDVQQMFVV